MQERKKPHNKKEGEAPDCPSCPLAGFTTASSPNVVVVCQQRGNAEKQGREEKGNHFEIPLQRILFLGLFLSLQYIGRAAKPGQSLGIHSPSEKFPPGDFKCFWCVI